MVIDYGNYSPVKNPSTKPTILQVIIIICQKHRLIFHYPVLHTIMGKKDKKNNDKKQENQQKTQHGKSITLQDTRRMLDLIKAILPIANSDWDKVARRFNEYGNITQSNGDTLKKKFNTMVKKLLQPELP
jgi:hypothetical protein